MPKACRQKHSDPKVLNQDRTFVPNHRIDSSKVFTQQQVVADTIICSKHGRGVVRGGSWWVVFFTCVPPLSFCQVSSERGSPQMHRKGASCKQPFSTMNPQNFMSFMKGFKEWVSFFSFFPQQRKLMGSSAQISSGVCRCGSQEQVPEEGSGRFRRVPACAGVGSGGKFRKVPECWCSFRRVPACAGRFRKVPEGSGVCWCRFRRQVPEGSGRSRCVVV